MNAVQNLHTKYIFIKYISLRLNCKKIVLMFNCVIKVSNAKLNIFINITRHIFLGDISNIHFIKNLITFLSYTKICIFIFFFTICSHFLLYKAFIKFQ